MCISQNAQNEKTLIERAQKGDKNAIEALLLYSEKRVYNIAFRFMGNSADAYDAAQESLIKIYKKISTYKRDASFLTWVYRICVNTCLDEIRKRKKAPVLVEHIQNETEGSGQFSPEDYTLSLENKQTIQKAINMLSEEQKGVIILRDINGLSYEEVAKCLGISIGTVKSRICRARQRLRSTLGADWNLI